MNISRRIALLGVAGAAGAAGLAVVSGTNTPPAGVAAFAETTMPGSLGREKVNLVAPPHVHPHNQIANRPPVIKEFRLTVEEKKIVVDEDGTTMHAMTYNGSIPAPMMVVQEGDYVELTLVNPAANSMAHNIDFHAATGALGGAELTLINPGEQAVLRFKATRAGVFVYHCAPGGPMIPWHVVSGMSGVVMVLPRGGLKDANGKPLHYDRVYYVGESDFYIPRGAKGKFKSYESAGDAYAEMEQTMRGLVPSHVVFNGKVGALTGKNAMSAHVGEMVLIVHSQVGTATTSGKLANSPIRRRRT